MIYNLPSPSAPKGPVPRRVPEGTVPLVAVEGTAYECGLWYGETIRKKYPNDVRVVIKNFPLGSHKQANKAVNYSKPSTYKNQ